jgi:hypothetical protein
MAAGVITGFLPGMNTGGIGFGLMTLGGQNSNLTFGGGYGWVNESNGIILNLAGMLRTGEHFSLVTENWYFLEEPVLIVTYGGRYMGQKISVDVGFLNNREIVEAIPIGVPILGVVIYL